MYVVSKGMSEDGGFKKHQEVKEAKEKIWAKPWIESRTFLISLPTAPLLRGPSSSVGKSI